eukprot:3255522-Amphidinium_carterae.1
MPSPAAKITSRHEVKSDKLPAPVCHSRLATCPCKVPKRIPMRQDTLHGKGLSLDLALLADCYGKAWGDSAVDRFRGLSCILTLARNASKTWQEDGRK